MSPTCRAASISIPELLGFRITDTRDLKKIPGREECPERLEDGRSYFMRYGTDHHAFVLFNKSLGAIFGDDAVEQGHHDQPDHLAGRQPRARSSTPSTGSSEQGVTIQRVGRDMPGCNWHTYIYDPDGHTNELYYGIEQIGWDGCSKPATMYYRGFREPPELPQMTELQEVQTRWRRASTSNRATVHDRGDEYDVDGVMLPRPFKITKIGP